MTDPDLNTLALGAYPPPFPPFSLPPSPSRLLLPVLLPLVDPPFAAPLEALLHGPFTLPPCLLLSRLCAGSDLTTLGLNLNATEALYATFASPWAETPTTREPKFFLPPCYNLQKQCNTTSALKYLQSLLPPSRPSFLSHLLSLSACLSRLRNVLG